MARIKKPLTEEEVKKTGVAQIRNEYNDIARVLNKIINSDLVYCHNCGEFHTKESFYSDKRFASGYYPECKKSLLFQATDYDNKTKSFIDNRKKTLYVFQKLNLPFVESVYKSALTTIQANVGEKTRGTAYQHMLVSIKSLPQYYGLTWENSEFDSEEQDKLNEEINENSRIIKSAKKRFGNNYTNTDLLFLETEYQDWISRYPCDNKSQEVLFKNLCFVQLNIEKAQKAGKDTKDLFKSQQDIMSSLGIKPSQNNSNALVEAQTFGTLIQKYEETRPLPDIDPELEDVDKIGLYIDVFFRGHTNKMLGLKNRFSDLYERFMSKFTVSKPEYDSNDDSESLFEKIFGSSLEE